MSQSNQVTVKGICPDLGQASVLGHHVPVADDRRFIADEKLSIPQAAKAMGIGANSLRRIIGQGRLPVLKILKKTLILAADVEAFLQESRVMVRRVENTGKSMPALPAAIAHSRHLEG